MEAPSPINESSDLPTFSILVDGKNIQESTQVFSIRTTDTNNQFPTAEIKIIDGDPSAGKFEISDSDDFNPGKNIEIRAGYAAKEDSIFKGKIVSQRIEFKDSQGSFLNIICEAPLQTKSDLQTSQNPVLKITYGLDVHEFSFQTKPARKFSDGIIGKVKFQGSTLPAPGKRIQLSGFGERFNGNHPIAGISHIIEDGNWIAEVEFGPETKSQTNE